MFETLKEQPADKILMLMQAYKEDPREQKVDLGVGVYKDPQGRTPIMRAIKAAESSSGRSRKPRPTPGSRAIPPTAMPW